MARFLIVLAGCLLTTLAFSHEEEAKEEFFLSTPEQVAALNSEPHNLIGRLISPLSGQPVLREKDLVVKGAQDIVLSRTYIPPYIPCSFAKTKHSQDGWDKYNLYHHLAHNYKGWQFYPHLKLQFTLRSREVLLTDPNGMTLNFRFPVLDFSVAVLASSPYGLSNMAGDTPSGRYDPRNTVISYEEEGRKIIVHAIDGSTRFYQRRRWMNTITLLYLLEKELLSNGKVLKYHYDNRDQLNYVESLDPKEQFVYCSMQIKGSPSQGACHFTSSSGRTVGYEYQKRRIHSTTKEKHRGVKYVNEFHFTCPPILSSVSSPFYRHESLDYCEEFKFLTPDFER